MLKRKASKPGEGLGKPPAGSIARRYWRGVKMIPAVGYQKIDDDDCYLDGGEPQLPEVIAGDLRRTRTPAASWRPVTRRR